MKISSIQILTLIGCCLGDIHIQNVSPFTSRVQLTHSIKQGDYLKHKYEIFENLCKTPYKLKMDKYPVYYFNTLSFNTLKKITDYFYSGNVRRVPQNIKNILVSKISLAYWFMDDGTSSYVTITPELKTRNSTVIFCTDRYTKQEVELLIATLKENFDINSSIKHSKSMKNRYRIYIGTKDTQKFFDLIEPFIIPSMMYKIKRPYSLY